MRTLITGKGTRAEGEDESRVYFNFRATFLADALSKNALRRHSRESGNPALDPRLRGRDRVEAFHHLRWAAGPWGPRNDRSPSNFPRPARFRLALAVLLLLSAPLLKATDLKPETLQAWEAYVRQAQARTDQRASGRSHFLWVDDTPELAKRVRAGEVVAEADGGESPHAVPHGLIHHWIGAVFVPNANLDDVMSVLNEYGRYKDFYRPMVAESKLVEEGPDREVVRLLMVQKAYSVTAAVEADDEIQTVKLNADRAYSVSNSRCVREIADYGKPTEHALQEDQGPGYVWRMFTVTRVEQRDGGTYAEIEMIALSRGIPWAFRWLMQPLAERLPRNTMAAMLQDTREAVSLTVLARKGAPANTQVAESLAERRQAKASQ